jgi:hypothetical protein
LHIEHVIAVSDQLEAVAAFGRYGRSVPEAIDDTVLWFLNENRERREALSALSSLTF